MNKNFLTLKQQFFIAGERKDDIIQMSNEGLSVSEIANLLGLDIYVIEQFLTEKKGK